MRGSDIGHLEGGAKGTGEGVAVSGGWGLELLLEL
jgi:hypothetical protein